MALTFLVGGARSGKSSLAVALATRAAIATSATVHVVVTAEAGDDEMSARIDRHQAERPAGWHTIEAPRSFAAVMAGAGGGAGAGGAIGDDDIVIIDCLSFWVANRLMDGERAPAIEAEASVVAEWAAARAGATIAVSNEVGAGVVPDNALAREFRDTLGRVNAIWSAAAARALLVVAGRVVSLSSASDVLAELQVAP